MNNRRLIFEVARWEFWRFFKIKQEMLSLLVAVMIGFAFWGGKAMLERGQRKTVKIVVMNAVAMPFQVSPEAGIELVSPAGRDEGALREAVGRRELDGLLIIRNTDQAELVVHKEPPWKDELAAALSAARRQARLAALNLSPQDLATALTPVDLQVSYHEAGSQPVSRAEKVGAGIIIGLMLMGIFLGNAYLYTGITGEKQLRVTEQVISAISPQTWVDGKILGLSAVALIQVIEVSIVILLFVLISHLFGDGLTIPVILVDPFLLVLLLALAVLGFFFWYSFFAAIAATINDPNTSARNAFLLVPFLPVAFAVAVFKNPDTWLMKVFGLFPVTAPAVLPARLVLTEVAAWEILVAIILLLGSIWALRRAAGKIFALGILMYGKEPSWQEMGRWLKEA